MALLVNRASTVVPLTNVPVSASILSPAGSQVVTTGLLTAPAATAKAASTTTNAAIAASGSGSGSGKSSTKSKKAKSSAAATGSTVLATPTITIDTGGALQSSEAGQSSAGARELEAVSRVVVVAAVGHVVFSLL